MPSTRTLWYSVCMEFPAGHTFSDGKHTWEVPHLWAAAKELTVEDVPVESLLPWASDGDTCVSVEDRVSEIVRVLNADLQ